MPAGVDHALLVLPVAVRAAGVGVVEDVENRHVGAVEDASPAVVDEAQLDARAVGPRGGGWAHGEEPPHACRAEEDVDPHLPGRALARGRLAGARRRLADVRVGARERRRAVGEALDLATNEVDAHDLMLLAPAFVDRA